MRKGRIQKYIPDLDNIPTARGIYYCKRPMLYFCRLPALSRQLAKTALNRPLTQKEERLRERKGWWSFWLSS
jgi:hypothetical protein